MGGEGGEMKEIINHRKKGFCNLFKKIVIKDYIIGIYFTELNEKVKVRGKFYIIMFLKLLFLESSRRKELFQKFPPKYMFVHSERVCLLESYGGKGGGVAYAWYVWEKGYKGKIMMEVI